MKLQVNDFFPSNYWRGQDLAQPVDLTIRTATREEFGEEKQEKIVVYFVEDPRGLPLNKTNFMLIIHSLGDDTDRWVGQKLELRAEPVSFQGRVVDAIRVRVVPEPVAVDDIEF